jgi:hypothetical protein
MPAVGIWPMPRGEEWIKLTVPRTFDSVTRLESDPIAKTLLHVITAHGQLCGDDRLLTSFLDVVPVMALRAADPVLFARELRRIATDVIIDHRQATTMPSPAELLPGCSVWTLEAKRLLDGTAVSHPWELTPDQQQNLHEGLLRRIKGSSSYLSLWPKLPSRCRTDRDHELDFQMSASIRTGRMTQPICQEVLADLYQGEHTDLFDPVFAILDLVQRGRRPRPEHFPELHLDASAL